MRGKQDQCVAVRDFGSSLETTRDSNFVHSLERICSTRLFSILTTMMGTSLILAITLIPIASASA